MSQSGSVQQSVSAKPVITGRTGLIQVVPASSTSAGQSLIQHATPLIRSDTVLRNPNNVSSNTAVQYIRKPTAITVLNPANAFVASPVVQPYTTYGTVMSLNPGVIQSLPSSTGLSSSGVNQVSGGAGSALSSLASSRKPCNCTKSHCLKLYCECFAQGQLCQNCNCNNCMNNLGYEEERGRAIKMTLERNPTAFHPKIGRGEGERRHTKGCNCKRSGCLKNYCECYEAKISCSDLCRCQGCRNTEDSVERRSLLRLAAMGSLRSRQPASFKKHLIKPHPETLPHVFFTWEVVEATAGCLLAQAEDAERRDLPPAAQERIVLEEFGRILEHVIDSASKAQIRSSNGLGAGDSEGEVSVLQSGGGPPSYSVRDAVGAATAAAAAADVLLHDDEDEEDEMMREISGMADNDPGDEDMFDDGLGPKSSSRRHLSRHSRRIGRPRRSRSALEIDSEPDSEDEPVRSKHRQSSRTKSRHADVPYRSRRSTAASGRTHDPDDII